MKLGRRLFQECPLLSTSSINDFLLRLKDGGLKNKSLNGYVFVIRHIGHAFSLTDLQNYPKFKASQDDEFIRDTLSDEEIDAFLALPYIGAKERARTNCKGIEEWRYVMGQMFFQILAWHGMRPDECASLKIWGNNKENYVDLGASVFRLNKTKTSRRVVPIYAKVKPLLEEYIQTLKGDYLFPVSRQTASKPYVGYSWWSAFFTRQIKRLGIRRPDLSTYSLRHSYVSRNVDRSLKKTQEIVGHKKIETTAHYSHNNLKQKQDFMNEDPLGDLYVNGVEALDKKEEEVITKDVPKYKGKLYVRVIERTKAKLVVEYVVKK
jgi:integrase